MASLIAYAPKLSEASFGFIGVRIFKDLDESGLAGWESVENRSWFPGEAPGG